MTDPILFWNSVAQECNRRDHTGVMTAHNQRGPTLSSRALAIVHIAMHDAYVLARAGASSPVVRNDPYLPMAQRPPYSHPGGGAPAEDIAASAVGAAAAVALLNLYPALAGHINTQFAVFSAQRAADHAAHRFGSAVGHNVLALRVNDGAQPDPDDSIPDYISSPAYGAHRADPLDVGQGFLGVRHGFVRPFAVSSFHNLAKYPAFGSANYLKDHREVRLKGATASYPASTRTPLETVMGIFWAYDGVKDIGTPPRLYNQILQVISTSKGLTPEQNARLFLLANIAMGDAGILAWFYKYHFDLWRPIVGIREFDTDMGPGASAPGSTLSPDCDPFWRPLGAPKTNNRDERVRSFTPPFPAYPSGHATFGAAAFHAARLYLAAIGKATIASNGTDDISFSFVSDELNGVSVDPDDTVRTRHLRSFTGLHEAIYENSISRIFLGVHWRFDGTSANNAAAAVTAADQIGGVPLGIAIAVDIAGAPNLRPTPDTIVPPAFDATP